MNPLEKTIRLLSPAWAEKRAAARSRLSARAYEGASKAARLSGWRATGASGNAHAVQSAATLRNRAHQMVRDNGWAKRAASAIVDNTVGRGIVPLVQPEAKGTEDALGFQAWWKEHCLETSIDADGRHNFYGLQRLFMRSTAIAGECLARARYRSRADGLTIPLQIQLLEPDHLDESSIQVAGAKKTIGGIHFDAIGRRVAYQLFKEHPGEAFGINLSAGLSQRSVTVPAEFIAHGYLQDRPGQVRGVSWFSAALVRLYNLDGYEDAELMRQRIAACFAAFIQDQDGEPTGTEEQPFEHMEPGAVTRLPAGCTVIFSNPPKVEGYGDYIEAQLRAVAMSLGLTYELLSGDYSRVNFSSGRMGHLATERTIDVWRKDVVEMQFCRPVMAWALKAAQVQGLQQKAVPLLWVPPRRAVIDPTKEIPAMVLAIKAGLLTWQNAVQQLGYDPDAQLDSIQEIQEKMKEAGVDLTVAPGGGSNSTKAAARAALRTMLQEQGDEVSTAGLALLEKMGEEAA